MKGIQAAIIGLGRIGYSFGLEKSGRVQPASHYHCYQALDEVDEIAVCDIDPMQRGKLPPDDKKITSVWKCYQGMLKDFKPDAVSICTPTPSHKEIAVAAAETPSVKAIFLEKPIASSIKDATTIIEACKKNNVRLSVNYTRRWDPTYNSIVNGGFDMAIGVHPGPLLRTGTHMIDLFNMIFGKPLTVQAFGEPLDNRLTSGGESNDYNINGVIQYESGQAFLISGQERPKTVLFELDLFGEKKRKRITHNGGYEEEYNLSPYNDEELNEYVTVWSEDHGQQSCLLAAIEEIVEHASLTLMQAVKPNSCSGEDALETLKVALALHYSAMHCNQIISLESFFNRRLPGEHEISDGVGANYEVKSY